MKVIVKESWKKAEQDFYKIPLKEREGLICWTADDFISGKEYEVAGVSKRGWYKIVDESGDEYSYPPQMFDIVG